MLGDGTELFLNWIFIFDVCLQFCHGYIERGYPVMRFRLVARRYINTWFVFDLLAAIPWERMVSQLSAVSLIKTIRLVRIRRLMSGLSVFAGGNLIRVFVILFFWLLVSHVSAARTCAAEPPAPNRPHWPQPPGAPRAAKPRCSVADELFACGRPRTPPSCRTPPSRLPRDPMLATLGACRAQVSACLFFFLGWNTCHMWYDETWVTHYWPQLTGECLNGTSPKDLHLNPEVRRARV